jgi:WD40 repeat protein
MKLYTRIIGLLGSFFLTVQGVQYSPDVYALLKVPTDASYSQILGLHPKNINQAAIIDRYLSLANQFDPTRQDQRSPFLPAYQGASNLLTEAASHLMLNLERNDTDDRKIFNLKSPNVTSRDLKHVYKRLALKFHPDKHASEIEQKQDPREKEFLKKLYDSTYNLVTEAYERLKKSVINQGGTPENSNKISEPIMGLIMESNEPVTIVLLDDEDAEVQIEKRALKESGVLIEMVRDTGAFGKVPISHCTNDLWITVVEPALKKLAKATEEQLDPQARKNIIDNFVRSIIAGKDFDTVISLCIDTIILSDYLEILELLNATQQIFGIYLNQHLVGNYKAVFENPLILKKISQLSKNVKKDLFQFFPFEFQPNLISKSYISNLATTLSLTKNICALGFPDGHIEVFDFHHLSLTKLPNNIFNEEVFQGSVTSLTFSPSGNMLAAGSASGSVRVWDVSNLSSIKDITTQTDRYRTRVTSLAFNSSSNLLAIVRSNPLSLGRLNVLDLTTGRSIRESGLYRIGIPGPIGYIGFSSLKDSLTMAWNQHSSSTVGTLDFSKLNKSMTMIERLGKNYMTMEGASVLNGIASEPSIALLVINTKFPAEISDSLELVTWGDGVDDMVELQFSVEAVSSSAFSHSGRILALASRYDEVIRLFDVPSDGKCMVSFDIPAYENYKVNSIQFSISGNMLAIRHSSPGKTSDILSIWDITKLLDSKGNLISISTLIGENGSLEQLLLINALNKYHAETGKKFIITDPSIKNIVDSLPTQTRELLSNWAEIGSVKEVPHQNTKVGNPHRQLIPPPLHQLP